MTTDEDYIKKLEDLNIKYVKAFKRVDEVRDKLEKMKVNYKGKNPAIFSTILQSEIKELLELLE